MKPIPQKTLEKVEKFMRNFPRYESENLCLEKFLRKSPSTNKFSATFFHISREKVFGLNPWIFLV
jgi:hypothetical protein